MAVALLPSTRQTPALTRIDSELRQVADGTTEKLMVFVPPQEGKALALDTPIATPSGWTTMGELSVGDQVFGRNGKPCRVTWISPTWTDRPCYVVRTGDGEAITADVEHEWPARLDRRSGEHLHTTKTLADQRSKNAQISGGATLDLPDADLPLDPYVLGAWLGDGHSTGARITSADPEIIDRIRSAGVPVRKVDGYPYAWTLCPDAEDRLSGRGRCSPIRRTLQDLGVWGNKHVPDAYLRGSAAQRLALLQGLIDTDGYVHPKGQVEFTSTNPRLAEAVRQLAFSLGAKAVTREGRATVGGRDCGPRYRVKFYLANAAWLPRKAARCKGSSVAAVRYVWAEPTQSVPTRCIEVDSPDHTFLAGRSLLPTHNSTRVACWYVLWRLVQDPTLRIAVVSYSQGKARRWGRWIRGMIKAHPELGVFLSQDSRAVDRFETTAGGLIISVGIEGGITGESVDELIIDDPVRGRAEAESRTYREAAWEWWESNASTRASSRFRCVLMQTRWHADDLAGRLMREEAGEWKVLRIPAVRSEDLGDVHGADGASCYHPNGELISVQDRRRGWFLELQRKRSGYVWRSIYMQDPTSAEGNLFKRPDFRYWYSMPRDPTRHGPLHGRRLELVSDAGFQQVIYLDDCWRFITVDLAASKRTSADWTVAAVWTITPNGDLILLDRARRQIEEPNHFGMIAPLVREWAAPDVFVEKGFIGSTLVIDATRAGVRVQPVSPETDKVTRALPATNRVTAHRAWFPAEVEWLDEWCDELAEFPTGRHDDQVDTFSYAARVSAANWLPWDASAPSVGDRVFGSTPVTDAYEAMTGQGAETLIDFDSVAW